MNETDAEQGSRILWLDNDRGYLRPYLSALESKGYSVDVIGAVGEAERGLANTQYGLLILDVMIPSKSEREEVDYPPAITDDGLKTGLLFYKRMKQVLDDRGTKVLVMTIRIDKAILDEFVLAGLPREQFANKTALNDVSAFINKIKSIIGDPKSEATARDDLQKAQEQITKTSEV